MLSPEVLAKIRHIEIKTRALLSGMQVGDYSTALKGSGFEFDQLREYQEGDDIRFIDWKSSARMSKLLVRQYLEERNRTILLAVDNSSSMAYGSHGVLKTETAAYLASILSLVADYGKDCVGLLLFTDGVETFIPPARGRKHIHTIMGTLFQAQPQHKKTSISSVIDYIMRLPYHNAIVFLVSDFIDQGFEDKLSHVSQRHDCIAVRCSDIREQDFPESAFITCTDPETGEEIVLDARKGLSKELHEYAREQELVLKKYGIDLLQIQSDKDCVSDMVRFFRRRMMY